MNTNNQNKYPQQPPNLQQPYTQPQPNPQPGAQFNPNQPPNPPQQFNKYPQQYPQQPTHQQPGTFGTQPGPFTPNQQFGAQTPNQGFTNPYSQQTGQNFSPYQNPQQANAFIPSQQNNNAIRNLITSYADNLFMKYDYNRSGYLDVKEIYGPVCELFQMTGSPAPSYQQVLMIMQGFDTDRNGLLDINEFRRLLFLLNGMPA